MTTTNLIQWQQDESTRWIMLHAVQCINLIACIDDCCHWIRSSQKNLSSYLLWFLRYDINKFMHCNDLLLRCNDLLLHSNDLLLRSNDLLLRSNDLLLRSNHLLLRSNDLLLRSNDLLLCSNDLLLRSTDLLLCSNDLLLRSNDLLMLHKMNHQRVLMIIDNLHLDSWWYHLPLLRNPKFNFA